MTRPTAAPSPAPASRARVRAALVSIQVLFGINYLASKILVTEIGAPAWASLRTLAAFVVVALIVFAARRPLPARRDMGLLAVASIFGIVLNQGLFLEGLARTTVGRSALICSQIPTFVLLFSVLGRQEPLTRRKAAGFVAGIAGVLVLLEADRFAWDARHLAGDLLTLANAASFALYVVLTRRIMARNDPLAATMVVFGAGAVGMFLYGGRALLATDLSRLDAGHLLIMAYVVLGATVATYFLNLWAVKRVAATRVAIFIFLQPLIAATLGVVFRGEDLTGRFVLASALIFTALLLRDGTAPTVRPRESA
ncbi:DMT family transporter [bacterium]|nr:DMT family transporter [bacterium]